MISRTSIGFSKITAQNRTSYFWINDENLPSYEIPLVPEGEIGIIYLFTYTNMYFSKPAHVSCTSHVAGFGARSVLRVLNSRLTTNLKLLLRKQEVKFKIQRYCSLNTRCNTKVLPFQICYNFHCLYHF